MSERKRFQIHLSTAVVLMFVAGGLIWANIAPRRARVNGRYMKLSPEPLPSTPESDAQDKEIRALNPGIMIGPRYSSETVDGSETDFLNCSTGDFWVGNRDFYYGWPYDAMYSSTTTKVTKSSATTKDIEVWAEYVGFENVSPAGIKNWHFGAIIIDALLGTTIPLAVWLVCEWWIRHRKAKKGA